jgi:uncharacterized protein Veg
MKIYVVINSTNRSMSPVLETSYHLTSEEGRAKFNELVRMVDDDYSSIYLEEFDTETKKVDILESFEGNNEFLDEEDEYDDE